MEDELLRKYAISGGSATLVTHRLRRCRLSGGCPITLWVDNRLARLSRLTKHLPLSTVHLLSRCSSLRDSMFHLIRDWGTSRVLVSSVVRRATMLGSVHRTSLRSLPSLQPTPVWSRGRLSRRRCPVSYSGQVNFTEAEEIL